VWAALSRRSLKPSLLRRPRRRKPNGSRTSSSEWEAVHRQFPTAANVTKRDTRSYPVLAEAASGHGFLNWMPDRDRVVASMPTPLPEFSPDAAIAVWPGEKPAGDEIGEPVAGVASGLFGRRSSISGATSRGSANFASLRRRLIEASCVRSPAGSGEAQDRSQAAWRTARKLLYWPPDKKGRPKGRPSHCGRAASRDERDLLALGAVADEAEAHEADNHHHPSRGFGNNRRR
jgi:hypothetical protein